MGQKVRPTGFRVGIMEGWRSRWYASKHEFAGYLLEDFKIRAFVKKKYSYAGIPKIEIERTRDAVIILLSTARPGVIIGRKGAEVEKLQEELQTLTGRQIEIKIVEVSRPEIDAQLISEDIAEQLEKRSSFRRTIKRGSRTNDGRRREGSEGATLRPTRRRRNVANGKSQRRFDTAFDAPSQGRLRIHRSQDGAGTHRDQSLGQSRRLSQARRGALRWP